MCISMIVPLAWFLGGLPHVAANPSLPMWDPLRRAVDPFSTLEGPPRGAVDLSSSLEGPPREAVDPFSASSFPRVSLSVSPCVRSQSCPAIPGLAYASPLYVGGP